MPLEIPQSIDETINPPQRAITVALPNEPMYPAKKLEHLFEIPRPDAGKLNPAQIEWGTKLLTTPYYTRTIRDLQKFEDLQVEEFRRFGGGLVLDVHGTLLGYGSGAFAPAVVEKLREIRARLQVCVLPDHDEEYSIFQELRIPVAKYSAPKPDPAAFERAAHNYLNLKPEQCIMVGDNLLTDGGAKQTGMGMILVDPLPGSEGLGYKMGRGYARAVKKLHDKLFTRRKKLPAQTR